jgi:hypothetical protein
LHRLRRKTRAIKTRKVNRVVVQVSPRYYKKLHKWDTLFVSGSVIFGTPTVIPLERIRPGAEPGAKAKEIPWSRW